MLSKCLLASHAMSDRTACYELLEHAKNDVTFLPSIITGYEMGQLLFL
jgi:hypothetical protein